MLNWQDSYQSRVMTSQEAVKAVKSGDRMFLAGNASLPLQVPAALAVRAPEHKNVEICHPLAICPSDYVSPGMGGHLRINSMFISANVRTAVNEGRAEITESAKKLNYL